MRFFQPNTCSRSNLNNHSLVAVVSYAGSKIIIPGDNEAASWNELLEYPAFVQAIRGTDILLAAHHGREAGYSETCLSTSPQGSRSFLMALDPKRAQ